MIVQTGAKAHFTGDLTQAIEALAHGFESRFVEMRAVGKEKQTRRLAPNPLRNSMALRPSAR